MKRGNEEGCLKRRYLTRIDALPALAKIQRQDSSDRENDEKRGGRPRGGDRLFPPFTDDEPHGGPAGAAVG